MFCKELVRKCDILLFRPKNSMIGKLIAFLTAGKYSHAALYIGDGKIIESHYDTGVVETDLGGYDLNYIDVYRVNIDELDIKELIAYNKELIGSGYDLLAFPSTFLKSVVAKMLKFRFFRKLKPLFNDDDDYYCSEQVSSGFIKVLSINLVPGLHPQAHTPSDLARGIAYRVS